jgi:restriction system protein
MSPNKQIMWGMHAGKTGDADSLFLKRNYIAIGWRAAGDLSQIKPDRDAFKVKVAEAYPHYKPGAVPVSAGQLYRFTHEMKPGDLVVYPSKNDRHIHIGQVNGEYKYGPKIEEGYPNLRPVKWLRSFPRTHFTQGALYEIGSAMSLFQVKNYADESRADLEGKTASQPPSRVSPEGADGGVDIIAHKNELGFEPPIIKVQAKSSEGSVGDPIVSALYGKVERDGMDSWSRSGRLPRRLKTLPAIRATYA